MFFVLIGIVILFISFVIALFSLTREQNEQEEPLLPMGIREEGLRDNTPAEQEVQMNEPVLADLDNQDVVGRVDAWEPFPWEEVKIGGGGRATLSGEISLSALRQKD